MADDALDVFLNIYERAVHFVFSIQPYVDFAILSFLRISFKRV